MARRDILVHPDPILRQPSAAVTAFDDDLQQLVDDLLETLYATSGIGLSAPQVGELRQVAVMDLSGNASAPEVYVNPAILAQARPGLVEESCLSLPGVVGNVVRATRLTARAQDRHGVAFERDLHEMHAVCLQHELDHLNGLLFIDRLSWFRRLFLPAHLRAEVRAERA